MRAMQAEGFSGYKDLKDNCGAAQPTPFAHGITVLPQQDEHCASG